MDINNPAEGLQMRNKRARMNQISEEELVERTVFPQI